MRDERNEGAGFARSCSRLDREEPMYKLYNVKRWGSISAHLVLEELDVPYQNVWMTRD